MPPFVIALVPAAITLAITELVCRVLLRLPDSSVPLVVFPLTFLVWGLTAKYVHARRARSGRRER